MALVNYRLQIDTTGNNTVDTDLTSLLREMRWQEGFAKMFSPAASGSLTFVLDNDGRFTESSSTYVFGRRITLEGRVGAGSWSTIVEGTVNAYYPTIRGGRAVCLIEMSRWYDVLAEANLHELANVAGLTETTTTTVASTILASAPAAAFAPAASVATDGLVVHYAGGVWNSDVSVLQALADTAAAEFGKFYIGRDLQYVFKSRRYLQQNMTVAATVSDLHDLDYRYPVQQYANVLVTVHPRTTTAATVLGSVTQDMYIGIGKTREFRVRYTSDEGATRSALSTTAPDATDYTIDKESGGAGSATVTFTDKGSHGLYSIENTDSERLIVKFLRVRGTALDAFKPVTVQAGAGGDLPDLPLGSRVLDDVDEGQNYADWVAGILSEDLSALEWIEIDLHNSVVLSLYLLDRITVTYDGVSEDYFVRMIDWQVPGQVRYYLEFASTQENFRLNKHNLSGTYAGGGARLGW